MFGAHTMIRTRHLRITSALLYQMSYVGVFYLTEVYHNETFFVKPHCDIFSSLGEFYYA
jgi:hypothetical protein